MTRQELVESYRPIWDMETPRSSCIIPEQPLFISEKEEYDLNQIALGIWNTVSNIAETSTYSRLMPFRDVKNAAQSFPEGITLPPAIRADAVRTDEGIKVVELDPITAISLGETALLASAWQEAGYTVIEPPTGIIARAIKEKEGRVNISVPDGKSPYRNELNYLRSALEDENIDARVTIHPSANNLELSAWIEDPASAKAIRRNKGWISNQNPLWGSLVGLSGKDILLDIPPQLVDARLSRALPRTARTSNLLEMFEPNENVVYKPVNGTGSRGVFMGTAREGAEYQDYIAQELLAPVPDMFGEEDELRGKWISRISIYAGRIGLMGAQVTARRSEGQFTNAHGQADAVQTTLALRNTE